MLRTMLISDLDAVVALENRVYGFPWTRGNFTDSLAAGHLAQVLWSPPGHARQAPSCLGYYLAMAGFEETHLLNITVHPDHQGQGHARQMLLRLMAESRALGARLLWLEVRRSNARAQRLYTRWGFEEVGVRKAYYPAGQNQREDALVMRLPLDAEGPVHALD